MLELFEQRIVTADPTGYVLDPRAVRECGPAQRAEFLVDRGRARREQIELPKHPEI